ncbi:MAG: CE1 family esterase [Candidatus Xenobia bacterium]
MRRLLLIVVACLAVPWLACAQSDSVLHVSVHGTMRAYRFHLPADRNTYRGPLVMALCGTETGAAGFEQTCHLDREADEEGFVVVYPEPQAGGWHGTEELAFVQAVMRDAVHRWFLDWHRIYLVGFSNGGVLTYTLAEQLSNRLAGAACVAANMPDDLRNLEPQLGLSLLVVNGTRDPLMPYHGGPVSPRLGGGNVLSTRETVEHWVNADECDAAPPAVPMTTETVQDGIEVQVQRWHGGRDHSDVACYRVQGAGHTWPGALLDLPSTLIGRQCRAFDAADTVWQFLKSHRRVLSID